MTTKQDSSWTLGDSPIPRPRLGRVALLLALPAAWYVVLSALSHLA